MVALRLRRLRAAIAGIVALGLASAAGAQAQCQNARDTPDTATPRALANATICLVNHERRRRGLRGVAANRRLSRAAMSHTVEMVELRYFSHVSKAGLRPVDRLAAAGYFRQSRRWAAGENLAWGIGRAGTPRAIVAGWMTSPGHRRNILGRGFREIGVGVATVKSAAVYTANFGYRR